MPSRDEHITQARHNAAFYAAIDRVGFPDWAVTVLFYTALHYVDALLAEKGNIDPTKHTLRSDVVSRLAELKPVYGDYEFLKNASYNSRYKPPTRFSAAYIQNLETRHLAHVRGAVARHITV